MYISFYLLAFNTLSMILKGILCFVFCNVNKNKPKNNYHMNFLGIIVIILEKYVALILVKCFFNYSPHATVLQELSFQSPPPSLQPQTPSTLERDFIRFTLV